MTQESNDTATAASGSATNTSTSASQLAKLRDANNKYKNVLKLAKERIQNQEEDITTLKAQVASLTQQWESAKSVKPENASSNSADGNNADDADGANLLRVHQRIRVDIDPSDVLVTNVSCSANDSSDTCEIWALLEFETVPPDDTAVSSVQPPKQR